MSEDSAPRLLARAAVVESTLAALLTLGLEYSADELAGQFPTF